MLGDGGRTREVRLDHLDEPGLIGCEAVSVEEPLEVGGEEAMLASQLADAPAQALAQQLNTTALCLETGDTGARACTAVEEAGASRRLLVTRPTPRPRRHRAPAQRQEEMELLRSRA